MSNITNPPSAQSSKANTPAPNASSAWARGPPSNPISQVPSGVATPTSPPSQNGPLNGSAPVPIAGHSRKNSMMVGGGMDIKKGPLNFGTVDAPNTLLSSSPAAPSTTGMHLTDAVKSFGSIEADASDSSVVASRRQSTLSPLNGSVPEKKKLDMHSLFTNKPQVPPQTLDRRLSQTNYQSGPLPNGQPFLSQFRPGPQSPSNMPYQQHGFRPQQLPPQQSQPSQSPQPQPIRPNGMPQMQQGMRPMMPPYGQNYPMMGYQGGFYPGYYEQQQYGMPQWAPQQHPQNQFRPPPSQPSPVPPPAQLPSSGGPSPLPTPPTRPPSLMTPPPSTPSRPVSMQSTPSFTPQPQQFAMSGGAAAFTPRPSKAIKFTRPDGTAIDIKQVAAKPSSVTPEPEAPAEVAPPKKKIPALPVIVRIESEEQKKARLHEEEDRKKLRALEEQEEKERKERKERQEAERAAKAEADRLAKEEADRNAKEEEDRKEQQRKEAEVAAKKEEEDRVRAEQEAQDKAQAEAKAEAEAKARSEAEAEAKSQPPASPALAGLPPKPVTRPPALDIKDSPISEAPPSALATARPISDLQSIVYPGSYKPPSPDLNADAPPGKFRYDREFLMQFMAICREKPDGLPPLDEIGLEADSSSGFGTGRNRGSRSSMGPPPRGGAAGLGIGNIRPASGMGAFGMGSFGSGSITRGTTSEERFNRSISRTGMARTPSQGNLPGLHGLPPMSSSASRGGHSRSQRGNPRRAPQEPRLEPGVAPLAISSNSWVKARPTDDDESSPAFIERKVKALLNKLTEEKFDSISNQIRDWANKSRNETDGLSLKLVIKQLFEKATDEPHWVAMYAKLGRKLHDQIDPDITEILDGKPVQGGTLFRKYLLGRCQVDFEAGWKAREDAAAAAAAKSAEDKQVLARQEQEQSEGKEPAETVMLSDEYYIAQKAKRRGLGLVQLIGELFKLDMISKNIIRTCMQKLIGNVAISELDEEDVESTCKLLITVGEQFEKVSPDDMASVMNRLELVLREDVVPSRVRFMIMDIIEIRKDGWRSRKQQSSVMTIAEIHQQAAREQAEKAAAAQRESISRGGSRAGHSRQQPGEWQSVASGARTLQRPDTSNLGRNFSSSGMPTFGPQSHFASKRKPGVAGVATPPLSRQASTTNMFGVLSGETETAPAERRPSTEEVPQRKKLNLAPRTKPVNGEGDEEEGSGEDEEVEAEAAEPATMSSDAAKAKIALDMKELWGEKDQGGSRNPDDIAEYFKALPEEHRPLLANKMVDEMFRISKMKDAEVIGKGFAASLEQGVATQEVLKKGIELHMTSLDDDSIDFPQAYRAIGLLMRSISLSEADITTLIEMVDVFDASNDVAKEKLNKGFAALDAEAAK